MSDSVGSGSTGTLDKLDKLPWVTILAGIIVVIVAAVGGIAVLVGNSLKFDDYVKSLSDLAVGVGLVGVGRGINKAGAHVGQDSQSR